MEFGGVIQSKGRGPAFATSKDTFPTLIDLCLDVLSKSPSRLHVTQLYSDAQKANIVLSLFIKRKKLAPFILELFSSTLTNFYLHLDFKKSIRIGDSNLQRLSGKHD